MVLLQRKCATTFIFTEFLAYYCLKDEHQWYSLRKTLKIILVQKETGPTHPTSHFERF